MPAIKHLTAAAAVAEIDSPTLLWMSAVNENTVLSETNEIHLLWSWNRSRL